MQPNRRPSCHQASLLHLVRNQVFHQLGTCLIKIIEALHRHPMLRWVSARWGMGGSNHPKQGFHKVVILHSQPLLKLPMFRAQTLLLMECHSHSHSHSLLPMCNHSLLPMCNHNHLLMHLKVIEMELLEVTVKPLPHKNLFALRAEGIESMATSIFLFLPPLGNMQGHLLGNFVFCFCYIVMLYYFPVLNCSILW